jgi:hypothetical protein
VSGDHDADGGHPAVEFGREAREARRGVRWQAGWHATSRKNGHEVEIGRGHKLEGPSIKSVDQMSSSMNFHRVKLG